MNLLAVSGSLNESSANTALLRAVRDVAAPADDVLLFDGLDAIPHFSPDRDRDPVPPAVVALREQLATAVGLVIATPEYAGGMPGSLKNALDWLVGSGELYGKPVVVVSAAPSEERGHRAREWVEATLRMQGASVRDSFTVALGPARTDEQLLAAAERVLDRTRLALDPAGAPLRP